MVGRKELLCFYNKRISLRKFSWRKSKEQVYRPDWSTPDRLEYTVLLFEILEKLLQPGEEGSVSTLPGSFKEFHSAGEIPKLVFSKIYIPVPGKLNGLKRQKI